MICGCGHSDDDHVHRQGACRVAGCGCFWVLAATDGGPRRPTSIVDFLINAGAAHFQGGPQKSDAGMVRVVLQMRESGGLSGSAALMLSQLLLDLAGQVGGRQTMDLVRAFLDAADVREVTH